MPVGHAYTLIGCYELKDEQGNVVEYLYKLRNPWGVDAEYSGSWRDDDPNWTDSYKAQVGYVSADDGIYFISKKDFVPAFDSFGVYSYNQDWKRDTI